MDKTTTTMEPGEPVRIRSEYTSSDRFGVSTAVRAKYDQFADIYYARLGQLKPAIEKTARARWNGLKFESGRRARQVDRVLDVGKDEICWIVGTVFMDYSAKPNVLDDLIKEHWIITPEERNKYFGPSDEDDEAITVSTGPDKIMLEDESGRVQLVGRRKMMRTSMLVTGAVIGVLGVETTGGTFEVLDIATAGLAPHPSDQALGISSPTTGSNGRKGKLAIVSGLGITTTSPALLLDLLAEFVTGEATGWESSGGKISRLVVAGNALGHSCPILSREDFAAGRSNRTNKPDGGNDGKASDGIAVDKPGIAAVGINSSTVPMSRLDRFLTTVLTSVPVTILPGASDPTGVALPQPPLHRVLLPSSRQYCSTASGYEHGLGKEDWLSCVTNPWFGHIDGWSVLAIAGQTIDDQARYVDQSVDWDRVRMAEQTLEWRVIAPTAPDTVACFPFRDKDPFVLSESPHLYIIGNQPEFATAFVSRQVGNDQVGVRIVCVPDFHLTGIVVLVDMDSRQVEIVKLQV